MGDIHGQRIAGRWGKLTDCFHAVPLQKIFRTSFKNYIKKMNNVTTVRRTSAYRNTGVKETNG